MASSSGNSSGTTSLLRQSSSSEEDLQLQVMDERKRKRMESNRESARRSRMRKQKHLDDLAARVALLRRDNADISNTVELTTQHYLNLEAENSVLRAQMAELTTRLDSLSEILSLVNPRAGDGGAAVELVMGVDGFMGNHWNLGYVNHPIMASADYFGC